MDINLKLINEAFLLEASNDSGNTIRIDASPEIGGVGGGARPMETVIMALGGCSSIDVLSILRKQRQTVKDFSVKIKANRREGETPSLFRDIHIEFRLVGAIDPEKAQHAADLSIQKYCSVAKIIEKTAEITYSVVVEQG